MLAEEVAKMARKNIQNMVERADTLLHMCNNFEDCYRDAGIAFHKTERAARHAMEHNTSQWGNRYATLEKAFLLDSYEDMFVPLKDRVRCLTELRTKAQHIPSAATAEQLMFVLRHEILPAMDGLITDCEAYNQWTQKLKEDANLLQMFNEQLYQVNGMGGRCAWHDPVLDLVNSKRTVRSRTGECTLFSDWVYSLPEAQRALEVQAGLDGFSPCGSLFEDRLFTYSMDLIWSTNEMVVSGDA
jgi:hypothetical protein